MRNHVNSMKLLVFILCSQLCFSANLSTLVYARHVDRSHLAPSFKEDTYEDMGQISKAKKGGIKAFLSVYPGLKDAFGSEFITRNWQDIVALRDEEKGENSIDYLFSEALPGLTRTVGREWVADHWDDLIDMSKAARGQAGHFLGKVMPIIIRDFPMILEETEWDLFRKRYLAILKHRYVSEHNRSKIYELLFDEKHLQVLAKNSANLSNHLAFYAVVITREKRPAYQILQGILKGFDLGLVDALISADEQNKIFEFADRMHNFSPTLFLLYKHEGEEALQPLEEFALKVITDDISKDDIYSFINLYNEKGLNGRKILAAALQITIPTSGTSFIRREEIIDLIDQYIEADDLRGHVPASLKGRDFGGEDNKIKLIKWERDEDEVIDSDNKIAKILELLRYRDGNVNKELKAENHENDRDILKTRLKSYLSGEINGDEVLDSFLIYVSNDDLIREKVDRIDTDDHQGLTMLEQIFVNKDNLSVLLEEIIEEVRREDNVRMPVNKKKTDNLKVRKPGKIASQIEGIWESKSISPQNKKISLIEKILQPLNPETQEQIIDMIKVRKVKKEAQRIVKGPKKPQHLTAKGVVKELFEGPINEIRKEKDKFKEIESDEAVELEFRVVKGIPWCLWGLNAGICNAWDIEMWKQPGFKLLAITDKKTGKAVGFAHLFEKNINGKNVLVVPGIEPSVEFLSQVRAEQIYPAIEKALIRVAALGNFDALYFPTENIKGAVLSNRTDIVKEVIKSYGENPVTLEEAIQWNFYPNKYPIKEVYVVWEKAKTALIAASISEMMHNMIPELETIKEPDDFDSVRKRIKVMRAKLQAEHNLKTNDQRMKILKTLRPPMNVNVIEQNVARLVKRGVIDKEDRAKFVALFTPGFNLDKVGHEKKAKPEICETIGDLLPELERLPTIPSRLDLILNTLRTVHNLSPGHPALTEFEDLRPPVALTLIDLTLSKLVGEKFVRKEDKLRLKDLLYPEMTAGASVELKEGEAYWSPEDGKLVRIVSIERDSNYPEFGEKVKLMIDTVESVFYRNFIKLKLAQLRPADEAPGGVLQPEDDSFRMFDAKDPDEIAAKRYVTNETYIVKRITPEPFSSITVLHGYKPWKDLYIECGLSIVGMNALVEMFHDDLTEYWPFLVETALSLKKNSWNFFRYSLGSVKHLIKSQEDLETVMGLLLEMRANARNQTSAKNITEKLLPAVAHRIKNIDDLREIGAYLVEIDSENKGKTSHHDIESLIDAAKEHTKALNKGIAFEEYMRAAEIAIDIGA